MNYSHRSISAEETVTICMGNFTYCRTNFPRSETTDNSYNRGRRGIKGSRKGDVNFSPLFLSSHYLIRQKLGILAKKKEEDDNDRVSSSLYFWMCVRASWEKEPFSSLSRGEVNFPRCYLKWGKKERRNLSNRWVAADRKESVNAIIADRVEKARERDKEGL